MLSKRGKLLLLSITYILVCAGYIYNLYAQSKNIIDENINNKLYFGALATAAILGDSFHDNLIDKNSKSEAEDKNAIQRLTQYNNQVGLTFIYAVIKKNDQLFLTSSSASEEELAKQTYVRFFDPYPDASQALSESFNRNDPTWVDYTDHWGDFRAVFVPLHSRDGTPYVAGAEISLQQYHQKLKSEALNHAGIAILIFSAFSLLVALYLFRMRYHLDQMLENRAELHQAKIAAETAARAKGDFLATMSHEIRTPLNGIIGATDLILADELPHSQRKYMEIVHSCGESLLALINDVLDFSKIEADKLELNNQVFALRPLINNIIETLQPNIKNQAVALKCVIAKEVPDYIFGDSQRLRQVLTNLIGNAIKFTAAGEILVAINLLAENDQAIDLRFSVRDTGIGISPEHQPYLFQAFSQVDASSTRRFGGTGLGLAISQRLVKLMGGNIDVVAQLTKGTEFFFVLKMPKNIASTPHSSAKDYRVHDAALTKILQRPILLAEDNPVNQHITQQMLKKLGYSVVIVENGQDAVSACRQELFEIILMDVHMPGVDGITATRQLRELELIPQPYIIAFTANAFSEELAKCYDAGMNDHLTKPATMAALAIALEKATASLYTEPPNI